MCRQWQPVERKGHLDEALPYRSQNRQTSSATREKVNNLARLPGTLWRGTKAAVDGPLLKHCFERRASFDAITSSVLGIQNHGWLCIHSPRPSKQPLLRTSPALLAPHQNLVPMKTRPCANRQHTGSIQARQPAAMESSNKLCPWRLSTVP